MKLLKRNKSLEPGKISWMDALLICDHCKQTRYPVNTGLQIEECPNCGKKTNWKLSEVFSSDLTEDNKLKNLALFAQHNPQPLFRLNMDGIIIGSNPASEKMFGEEYLLGQKLSVRLKELESVSFEKVIENDGVIEMMISLNDRFYNLILKGVSALRTIYVYGHNITEIKQAELKIAQQAKEINDSIHYASRIQKSLLPGENFISRVFKLNFVFYQPKDIVSGDFYWVNQIGDIKLLVVADSTGHGVPGAFMSMLGISLLNDIILREEIIEPNEILNELRRRLIISLSLNQDDFEINDGMDIAVVAINTKDKSLAFSGAYNPLVICRGEKLIIHEGDRMPVGKFVGGMDSFTLKTDIIKKGDRLFMFSDGFKDQFGGKRNKKYSRKRFKELIIQSGQLSINEVKDNFQSEFEYWKHSNEQVDDVLVVGVEVE